MNRIATALVAVVTLLVMTIIAVHRLIAATPSGGAISADSPTITWAGRAWTAPNPLSCFSAGGIDPTCDRFALAIVPPKKDFVVTIRVTAANATDQAAPTDDRRLHDLPFLEDGQDLVRSLAGLPEEPAAEAPLSVLLGRTVSFPEAAAAAVECAEALLGEMERPAELPAPVAAAARHHEERFRSAAWTWQR